jgi:hypothetical protein
MENSMEFPQKNKNRNTTWSSNSTSGYIAKGNEISVSRRYLHSYFHHSVIHNSQDIESI